jgi:hypothetical protein
VNEDMRKRANKLMREIAEEIELAGGSIERGGGPGSSSWHSHRVNTDEGVAAVGIQIEEYFSPLGFRSIPTGKLRIRVDGVWARGGAGIRGRSFIERKNPLDPEKIAAFILTVAREQAKHDRVLAQQNSGRDKSAAACERLAKRAPELDGVKIFLRTTDTGHVALGLTADEATIAEVFEALKARC